MLDEAKSPFVRVLYENGDVDYAPSEWQAYLDELRTREGIKQHDSDDAKDYIIKEDEIAVKHPVTGSIMKMSDDGSIDLFVSDTVGIRLDRNSESISIFAKTLNYMGKKINMNTKSDGFIWNDNSFDARSLYPEKGLELYRSTEYKESSEGPVRPMKKAPRRSHYSDGVLSMMSDLGIPVENHEEDVR